MACIVCEEETDLAPVCIGGCGLCSECTNSVEVFDFLQDQQSDICPFCETHKLRPLKAISEYHTNLDAARDLAKSRQQKGKTVDQLVAEAREKLLSHTPLPLPKDGCFWEAIERSALSPYLTAPLDIRPRNVTSSETALIIAELLEAWEEDESDSSLDQFVINWAFSNSTFDRLAEELLYGLCRFLAASGTSKSGRAYVFARVVGMQQASLFFKQTAVVYSTILQRCIEKGTSLRRLYTLTEGKCRVPGGPVFECVDWMFHHFPEWQMAEWIPACVRLHVTPPWSAETRQTLMGQLESKAIPIGGKSTSQPVMVTKLSSLQTRMKIDEFMIDLDKVVAVLMNGWWGELERMAAELPLAQQRAEELLEEEEEAASLQMMLLRQTPFTLEEDLQLKEGFALHGEAWEVILKGFSWQVPRLAVDLEARWTQIQEQLAATEEQKWQWRRWPWGDNWEVLAVAVARFLTGLQWGALLLDEDWPSFKAIESFYPFTVLEPIAPPADRVSDAKGKIVRPKTPINHTRASVMFDDVSLRSRTSVYKHMATRTTYLPSVPGSEANSELAAVRSSHVSILAPLPTLFLQVLPGCTLMESPVAFDLKSDVPLELEPLEQWTHNIVKKVPPARGRRPPKEQATKTHSMVCSTLPQRQEQFVSSRTSRALRLSLPSNQTATPLVDFRHYSLGTSEAMVFAERLQTAGRLPWSLLLGNNHLNSKTVTAIVRAMVGHSEVLQLDLSGNSIGGDAVKALCELCAHPDCGLTCLDLSNCKLGDRLVRELSSGLANATLLTALSLSGNNISKPASVEPILQRCSLLASLDLSWNALHDTEILAGLIGKNRCLIDLSLAFNSFEKCTHFADVLRVNPVLTRLNMSHNNLTDVSVGRLSSCLTHNWGLCSLAVLSNPGISRKGSALLMQAIESRMNGPTVPVHTGGSSSTRRSAGAGTRVSFKGKLRRNKSSASCRSLPTQAPPSSMAFVVPLQVLIDETCLSLMLEEDDGVTEVYES